MSSATLIIVLLLLSTAGYYFGRRRAFGVAGAPEQVKTLHSRPAYYGSLAALWCGIPALMLTGFWLAFQDTIITQLVIARLPQDMQALPQAELSLLINNVRNLVSGNIVSGEISPALQAAADHYGHLQMISRAAPLPVPLTRKRRMEPMVKMANPAL